MRGLGTVLNVAAIAVGASVGTLLGDRLPERLRDTLVAALGLFTLALGVQQALAAFGDTLAGVVGRSAPCWCWAPCSPGACSPPWPQAWPRRSDSANRGVAAGIPGLEP